MVLEKQFLLKLGNIINHYITGIFSRYSIPIHWLVHGRMTSNNETVSWQMPWAGNIAKTRTPDGKQFTVTCKMLTAVARDQRWPDATEISAHFFLNFLFFCLLYSKSLNDWSLGKQWILFPSPQESLRFSGNKIHCSPRDQSLSVNYYNQTIFGCKIITCTSADYSAHPNFLTD